MKKNRWISCLLFSLLLSLPLWGQGFNYRVFENISLEPDASVISCFVQDTEGMLWIGSDRGLFSYDGYSTLPYFTFGQRENTRIYCGITVDSCYLYLGSDNGLLVYNYITGQYEDTPADGLPTDIRALVLDGRTLWIGSLNGLYACDLDTRELKNFDRNAYPNLPHETIYSIIRTTDGSLYLGTYNGCCRYQPTTDTFESIPLPANINKSNQFVNSLLEDTARQCIWIGTEGSLLRYSPGTDQTERISAFPENSVKSLALDRDQYLLAATDNGLYVWHESAPLLHVVHDSRDVLSLSNNIIWNIFTDADHNVWLGTDYGISLVRFSRDLSYVPISLITGVGDGNHFYSIFKDSQANYWFGGTNGLIRFRDLTGEPQQVTWYAMGSTAWPLPHNRVRWLYEDSRQSLWVATDGSINRYDPKTRQFVHYNIVDSTGSYNCNWAYSLFEDDRGQLWIASFMGGIFVVDRERLLQAPGGTYTADYNYSTRNGLSGMFANQIVPDRAGNVWVLSYNTGGIDRIDMQTREVTHVATDRLMGETYFSVLICDSEGAIWTAFRNGVARFVPEKEQPEVVCLGAFSDNEVLAMTEVDDVIWLSTSDGVWVVDKQTMTARRLPVMNRMYTSLYYDRPENRVYMGSVDGFAVTSPALAGRVVADRPIRITALYVNNERLRPESLDGDRNRDIRFLHNLDLDYRQTHLAFDISDLPYALDEKAQFAYRLEGLDADWNLLRRNTNRITYSNLAYGDYRLEVSRLDANGRPSGIPCLLDVHIQPPWYYTGWAKCFYFLLLVSLGVWMVNFFRVKSRLRFERLEKEKILEQSQSKIDFFANVSHEFKTPLSMIIAPVSRLLLDTRNQPEKQQLEGIQRNAMKLNSLIHQLLDFSREDNHAGTSLILSRVEFVSFARHLFTVFTEETAKEKDLVCTFDTDCRQVYADIDVTKFEAILGNLLSNAFKFSVTGGTVRLAIRLRQDLQLIEVSVSDTGTGISQQDIPYIFQRFFQSARTSGKKEGTGIGLYLAKTYTELHGGTLQVASKENQGATFTLLLPLIEQETVVTVAEGEHPAAVADSAMVTDRPLVLVVDDNPEIAEFICEILQPRYRCRTAADGREGVELALELLPDLIVSDVMMPVMDGLEMCRHIRRNVPTSAIPVILLTARSDKETELESIHLNIDAFIAKPFEPDILLSRIEQLLNSKRLLEAKARIEAIATPKAIEAVSHDEKFLATITSLIEDRVQDPDLNVNALCELAGVNNKQIYRKLKQLTGLTPVDYIKSIRMKKAAMLLGQQKFTVAEVMYMVGFSNHSYFSKCFQAAFGKTPRQFAEEN